MPAVPPARTLYLPTLRALGDLGGSGTIQEIVERVIENEGYDEETQALPHGTGGRTELEYRLAWGPNPPQDGRLAREQSKGPSDLHQQGMQGHCCPSLLTP
jgi:restriction system protein